MKQGSDLEQKYDYERKMEELGLKTLRKSRKRLMIFTIIFVLFALVTFFPNPAGNWEMSLIFLAVAIVLFVFYCKKGKQIKDPVYVRKIGFEKSKKSGSLGPQSGAPTSSSSGNASGAPSGNYPTAASYSDVDERPSRDDGKDPDVWGPMKGF